MICVCGKKKKPYEKNYFIFKYMYLTLSPARQKIARKKIEQPHNCDSERVRDRESLVAGTRPEYTVPADSVITLKRASSSFTHRVLCDQLKYTLHIHGFSFHIRNPRRFCPVKSEMGGGADPLSAVVCTHYRLYELHSNDVC